MAIPILLKGGTLVTMDSKRRHFKGDLEITANRISRIGQTLKPGPKTRIIDVSDQFVIPGLIQTHTHLVQCLFRGWADDMSLLDWLRTRIWPLENAHTRRSIQASARLALTEMQLLGTTSVLDMATVKNTSAVFKTVKESGMRYWGGKCLMDLKKSSGPLYEDTKTSLRETERLIKDWHNDNDLMAYALCPRFAISCTEQILKACVKLQEKYESLIHTHASESLEEISVIKRRTGLNNVSYLKKLGLLNSKSVIVHGVHLTKSEIKDMVKAESPLVHCPSSNLKLASGIAPIFNYLKQGMTVSLGSDGAPCNNTMDPFMEMRLTALLQKPKFGPEALPAKVALEMATLQGAKTLGRLDDIGSLEKGKLADVVTVRRDHPSVANVDDPYSALVYSCSGRDVANVFINGKQVVKNAKHFLWEREDLSRESRSQIKYLIKKIRG